MDVRSGHAEPLRHVLSFDVEEHFQVAAFWSSERRKQWDHLESRVEQNTRRIADILAEHSARATFFILGWVAERHPDLVKDLARQGHEIASHGYGHELISLQTPSQFREDVRRAKQILEDLAGTAVLGYRAPSFSIHAQTAWALPILVEEGYRYDSSIYHKFKAQYDGTACHSSCYQIETSAGSLLEVPPSTLKQGAIHLPVAGGGYFRLFPYSASRMFLQILEKQGVQLVMYFHPWEIDPGQPRMEGPVLSKFRHYLNLNRTESRLLSLLKDFSFGSFRDTIQPVQDLASAA